MPKQMTTEQWAVKARKVHGDLYDYTGSIYEQAHKPITIRCLKHGDFTQKAYSHLNGRGCPGCAPEKLKAPRIGTADKSAKEVFVERARGIHGDQYDYAKVVYVMNHEKVTITCPKHGDFEVTPNNHVQRKSGCAKCYHEKVSERQFLSQDEFLAAAREIHGDRYDYGKAIYTRATDRIVIGCPEHGDFLQLATVHIHQQSGCPKCTHRVSGAETALGDFLESLDVTVIRNDWETLREKLGRREIDILLPDQKIAIEYCGLIWHSDKFGSKDSRHLEKHTACEELGIRLITIFEDEWLSNRAVVEAFFLHLLQKSPKGIHGRQAVLKTIPWTQAKEFLNKHHLLGSGTPAPYRIGAFDPAGELIAVMTFGQPSDERGSTKGDLIEMRRFVTDKKNHPGLGSKMFKWALREWSFQKVLAFVDRRWFNGGFKLISGFNQEAITEPTLWWTNGVERVKRRHFRREQLEKMPQFQGRKLSKRAMLKELGWYRIWDCGKLRFVWESISQV